MKKVFNSILLGFVSFLFISNVSAGSLSISASATNPTIGNNIVITVRASGLAGSFSITSSNGGVLSGGTSNTWIDDGTQTFTFKANSKGTATVTVTPKDVADYSGNSFSSSKSVTVNVISKPVITLSSDNSLIGLSVEGKELNPSFNKDTLEYSVELDPETTSININATPASGATVSGSGAREVTDGDNRLEIVVTAENGSQRTYVINASVKEYDPISVKVNGKNYTVIRKKSSLSVPNGYTETTIKINDTEIPALKSDITKYTLVGLKDESGTPNLYIYEDGKYTLYKEYTFNKVSIFPMSLDKIPTNYKEMNIIYNDEEIIAYKTKKSSKYALIYGMNLETGEKHIYMYDSNEDTLQIYNTEEVDIMNYKISKYTKVIIGLSILSFVLIIFSIIVVLRNKNKDKIKVKKIKEDIKK